MTDTQSVAFRQVEGVLEARISEGELVLLGPAGHEYVGLDSIGAEVWSRLRRTCRFDELVRALADDYDASPETIAADVRPLIDELVSSGLLERVGPAAE